MGLGHTRLGQRWWSPEIQGEITRLDQIFNALSLLFRSKLSWRCVVFCISRCGVFHSMKVPFSPKW